MHVIYINSYPDSYVHVYIKVEKH